MSVQLKIKHKHLALEPSIIKFEEQKILKQIKHIRDNSSYFTDSEKKILFLELKFNVLALHRRWDVRNESRATHLARAYIAGKEYKTVEVKRKEHNEYNFTTNIIPRIVKMVIKYGDYNQSKLTKEQIMEWCKLDILH
jgi:hypothetical protein